MTEKVDCHDAPRTPARWGPSAVCEKRGCRGGSGRVSEKGSIVEILCIRFSPVTQTGTHLVLRLTIGACQRLTPRASVVALGIQMSDSTQMTGTIGCRGNGGWFARIISRNQRSARQRAIDARLGFGQRVVAFGEACIDTRCANVKPNKCWNGATSALLCKKECCLRTPASQNGRREAVSLHKRPSFRNVGSSGSDHQWGNVEKAGAEACGANGNPGSTESSARCQSLVGNTPAPQRRRNPLRLVRRRSHAAGGRASRQLPG